MHACDARPFCQRTDLGKTDSIHAGTNTHGIRSVSPAPALPPPITHRPVLVARCLSVSSGSAHRHVHQYMYVRTCSMCGHAWGFASTTTTFPSLLETPAARAHCGNAKKRGERISHPRVPFGLWWRRWRNSTCGLWPKASEHTRDGMRPSKGTVQNWHTNTLGPPAGPGLRNDSMR